MNDVSSGSSSAADTGRGGGSGAPTPQTHGSLRRLVSNAASILSSEVVGRATSFAVYALVGRRMGSTAFGQLSLGLSLVYTFQILAACGQKSLMIREIARNPDQVRRQLRTLVRLVTVGTLVSLVPLAVLIAGFRWDRTTTLVVLAIFTALLPYALSQAIEGIMQGLEQMRWIAVANIPFHLLKLALVVVLVQHGAGIELVAVTIAASYWMILAVELVIVWRRLIPPGAARGPTTVMANARRGRSFLGVDIVYAVGTVTPVLVVSGLMGQGAVGVVGAALQAVVPLSLAVNSLILVTFPAMCRVFGGAAARTREIMLSLTEAMLTLVMPAVLCASYFAPFVIHLLYGNDELAGAAHLLRLIVWGSLVNVVATVLGQTLWATDRERISMVIGLWSALTSLVGHLIFVSLFDFDGVVAAMALVSVVVLVQHYRPLASVVSARALAMTVWRPAVAGVAQLGAFFVASPLGSIVGALIGVVTYLVVIVALIRLDAARGRRQQPLASLVGLLGHAERAKPEEAVRCA